MKHKLFLLTLILILNVVSSLAQTLKLPYKDVGACPFECCTYRQWTATKETVLLKNLSDNSRVLFKR